MLDQVLKLIKFKSVQGVKRCYVLDRTHKGETEYIIQLEGVNFHEVYKYADHIDNNRIYTNDIGTFLRLYGVKYSNLLFRLKLVERLLSKKLIMCLTVII